jgi:Spy/CpxP family protein refolding chaperone
MLVGAMLHATRQLNLTAEQQQTIKGILSAAKAQHEQAGAAAMDLSVLANPGDPNYATAVQSAKSRLAARLQTEIELQGQIYNVLTAEQKAQLPQVLASMKAKAQQRRAAWQQQHAAGNAAAANESN